MRVDHLAVELAVTIRHDGHGGVADDLSEPAGLTRWVRAHADALRADLAPPGDADTRTGRSCDGRRIRAGASRAALSHHELSRHEPSHADAFEADAAALAAAVEVRTAIRALFARAVLPGPPSSADTGRLPSAAQALDRLNAAAALVPYAPRLDWPHDAEAPTEGRAVRGRHSPAELLAATLARHAIAFLAGPDRELLRACPAPRCVRYFVKEHQRQEWCKPSCGNRARVARHHARHRAGASDGPGDG